MKFVITAIIALLLGFAVATFFWFVFVRIKDKLITKKSLDKINSDEIRKELEKRLKIK